MALGFPPENGCVAFVDLSEIPGYIQFGLKLFLGLCAALVVWFVGGPLVSLLWRLAFNRKPSGTAHTAGRAVLAGLAGFLVFLLVSLGTGGFGFGLGGGGGFGFGGTGTGKGTGKDTGKGTGKGEGDPSVKTDKGATGKEKDTAKKPGETLRVEIVVPERYQGGRRYYLIDGKEPGVTAEELEAMLEKEKGRWDRLEIITYKNSMSEEYGAEKRLQELADRHKLTSDWPREFWKKYKKVSDEK